MDRNMIGHGITILMVLGTFIYTQGVMSNKVESVEKEVNTHSIKVNKAKDDIVELQIAVAKIEVIGNTMEERFNRLESLIIEN